MKRFLGYGCPQELQNPPPLTTEQIKALKKKENPQERDPPQRSQRHTDSFSHSAGNRFFSCFTGKLSVPADKLLETFFLSFFGLEDPNFTGLSAC